jgi:hypothetical protein
MHGGDGDNPGGSDTRGVPLFAVAAVLWVASLLISGLGVYVENHAVQVPLVRWLNDPSLFPGDPFVAALARYPSALWRLVALAARVIPLGPLLLALHALSRLLAIGAAGRLALAFAPGSQRAATAAMALFAFAVCPFIGSGTIVNFYFEQSGVAVALVLLAIAAFHEERRLACGVWLGLACNASPLYAIFASSYFGAAFLLDRDYRTTWKSWLPAAGLFAALSSYTSYLTLSLTGAPPVDDALWLEAARARCWEHLFPADWKWGGYVQTALVAALLLVVVWRWTGARTRLGRHAILWTGVAAAWLATAFAAAYLFEWPPMLMLQPTRALDLWLCFAAITIFASSMSTIAIGAVFAIWMPPGWPLAVAALAVPHVRRRLAGALALWVVIVGIHHFANRVTILGDVRSALVNGPDATVLQVATWARTNTAKDDVFLVTVDDRPAWDVFRGLSQRSIYTSWEEGTAIHWDRGFVTEWTRRLADLGFDRRHFADRDPEKELDRIYAGLMDDRVRLLGRSHSLRYWIVPNSHPSGLKTAFARSGYKVLDLR